MKDQREKNKSLKIIPIEWMDTVFLCRKGTPVKNSTYDTGLFKYCDRVGIPRFRCTSTFYLPVNQILTFLLLKENISDNLDYCASDGTLQIDLTYEDLESILKDD